MVGGLCNAWLGNTGHVPTSLIKYNAWVNMLEENDNSDQASMESWPVIPSLRIGPRLPGADQEQTAIHA